MDDRAKFYSRNVLVQSHRFATDNLFFYFVFCFLAGLIAAMTIAAPNLKRKIMKKDNLSGTIITDGVGKGTQDNNIFLAFCYYLTYSTLHVLTMVLIMSYNGGVLLTMIAFSGLSYFLFGSHDGDSDMPINCCANAM